MSLGTKRVVHISFVVRDIKAVMAAWRELLGLEADPRIWNIPGPETAPTFTEGNPELYHDCLISVIELDNLVLEVVQPGPEPSPWKTFLEKHGEGLMHLAFLVPDEEEAVRSIASATGKENFYHIGYYPEQYYSFYDTYETLKTELNIKVNKDNRELISNVLKSLNQK
ncbi:MAG: VOC family protein [Blautia sp.]|nr:VOC family protein [Blautia sp.]